VARPVRPPRRTTWAVYDDEELWEQVVEALGAKLPGGWIKAGNARVWVDYDKLVAFTSWGVKAERRWYVEFALEGSEYLLVPYWSRSAWHDALESLRRAQHGN
jgi:hypothetical protein